MNTSFESFDVLIIGAGITGLTIARQILEKNKDCKIKVIEKERAIGLHTSGRNSGVLHAGIYYKPNSLKAKICVNGSKRLKQYIKDNSLPLNECGKLIVAQEEELDDQLDVLIERGRLNGATIDIVNSRELKRICSNAQSASGRAIWSPNTAVTKPIEVLENIRKEIKEKGVSIEYNCKVESVLCSNKIKLKSNKVIEFNYIFNCAGAYSLEVANKFNIGGNYRVIPFKGSYMELRRTSGLDISTNIYPVPDLELPFLGVHFTPDTSMKPKVSLGPTANIALGRSNYKNIEDIEWVDSLINIFSMGRMVIEDKNNIRKYIREQAMVISPNAFLKEAQKIVPSIEAKDLMKSKKVGIRPQLFNKESREFENDFICKVSNNSVHVLNTISPAFTASFELAELVINQSTLFSK